MGQDGGDGQGRAPGDGDRPDDGDDRVLQPDGSFTRRPSPRGGFRGVIDDLFAGQTPIDRRLSLMLVGGILAVPVLTIAATLVFRIGASTALLTASIVWVLVLVMPFARAVRQDLRLRRSGRRTGLPTVLIVCLFFGLQLLMTLLGDWLGDWLGIAWLSSRPSSDDTFEFVRSAVRGVVVGVVVVLVIVALQRMERRRLERNPDPTD